MLVEPWDFWLETGEFITHNSAGSMTSCLHLFLLTYKSHKAVTNGPRLILYLSHSEEHWSQETPIFKGFSSKVIQSLPQRESLSLLFSSGEKNHYFPQRGSLSLSSKGVLLHKYSWKDSLEQKLLQDMYKCHEKLPCKKCHSLLNRDAK